MSVMDKIAAGVAAINVDRMTPPQSERQLGDTQLATCDDYLKRLFAYHTNLVDEAKPVKRQIDELFNEITNSMMRPNLKGSISDSLSFMFDPSPEMRDMYERLKGLEADLNKKSPLINLVGSLFWCEVKHRHPELASKPTIAVRDDWAIVEPAETDNDEDLLRHGMFDFGDGGNLGDMLDALTRTMGRSNRGARSRHPMEA